MSEEAAKINELPCNVLNLIGSFGSYQGAREVVRFYGDIAFIAVRGDLVASAHEFSDVIVWRRSTGEMLKVLQGHTSVTFGVAFLTDSRLVSASDDKTLRIWDLETWECVKVLTGHTAMVSSVTTSGDSLVLSGSQDKTIKIWDATSGECLKTLECDEPLCCVTCRNDMIVSGSWAIQAKVWSLASGECMFDLVGHEEAIYGAFIGDKLIATGSEDNTVRVWNKTSGECVRTFRGHEFAVTSVVIGPGDLEVYSASMEDRVLKIWSMETFECVKSFEEGEAYLLVLDHEEIVSSCGVRIARRSLETKEAVQEFGSDIYPISGSCFENGRIVTSGYKVGPLLSYPIFVWNAETGDLLHTLHHAEGHQMSIACLAIQNDIVVSGDDDKYLSVWNLQNEEFVRSLVGHTRRLFAVAIGDGVIVSSSEDRMMIIWSLETGQMLRMIEAHRNNILALAIENGFVVSAAWDKSIKVWDIKTRTCLRCMEGHSYFISFAAIDNGQILTITEGKTARLWDLHTGEFLRWFKIGFPASFSNGLIAAMTPELDAVKILSARTGDCLQTIQDFGDLTVSFLVLHNDALIMVTDSKILRYELLDLSKELLP